MPDMILRDPAADHTANHAGAIRPTSATAQHLMQTFARCRQQEWPYRHWLLSEVLPEPTGRAVAALPWEPPTIRDTGGRRETHNASRRFFAPAEQALIPAAADIATALQHPATVAAIAARCGVDLDGSYLRIEYCLDREGFWLEPHTDIGAKRLTFLIYLSPEPAARAWGTDIYADPAAPPVARADARFNQGLVFVPGVDTWHGFEARPIVGVRRTLIVNYVSADWRSRHELAFPNTPVRR